MNTTVQRYTRQAVEQKGWIPGSELENRFALIFSSFRLQPSDLVQEHRVGRYRLDFADPDVLIAIEADGFHHRMPGKAESDAKRDRWLLSQGWFVFRISDEGTDFAIREALANVVMLLRDERAHQERSKHRNPQTRKSPQPSRLAFAFGYQRAA